MGVRKCEYCGSSEIEDYTHLGELICQDCGAVLQENTILEQVEYADNSSGNTQVLGRFVSNLSSGRQTLSYNNWHSREQVINRGNENIKRIAEALKLSPHHIDAAKRIYLLAVQRNFTMGRNNLHVASCCLYTICRREKTPHLLIDFSDVLLTPVKTIGQIFMKLVRMLHISVPNVDPSIFFERFATQLKLKDIHKIINTGNRIIQAMNRDWLCTGRRPTGLCGAALLVAARFHGIPLSAEAVSSVVRISHPTILKRLSEFKVTSTANIKVSEFDTIDIDTLPKLSLPPCLLNKLVKRKKYYDGDSTASECVSTSSDYERISTDNDRVSTGTGSGTDTPVNEINLGISNDLLCNDEPTPNQINTIAQSILTSLNSISTPTKYSHTTLQSDSIDTSNDSTVDSVSTIPDTNLDNSADTVELSSDDEDDLAMFKEMILPEGERKMKMILWDEVTKDIMPKVYRRQMERKRKEQLGQNVKKRKYVRRVYSEYPEAQDAVESARMALERHAKGFMNHVNKDVFKSLLSQST
ncbi:Transcription factor TFIIB repeat family protein [Theileria parva strain Muguga]|uniref:B-related factor 1 n=1 Tax=Theileria parva TaxID=5875 RepID=Q4MZA3_THEPA|nr:Transcription factor TFIIB repeat family protein [Theileria parva strain Muguga]EAN31113.1 Transcription factor TFIIB repeat family protein [Theileria parva strain Muguga]|eukprot:XP_763396.1 transcription factor IIIb subunit [Theileria parva strain Muguga]